MTRLSNNPIYVETSDFTSEEMDTLTPEQYLAMNPIPLPPLSFWRTIGGHRGNGTWRNRTVGVKPNPGYPGHISDYYVDHVASAESRKSNGNR